MSVVVTAKYGNKKDCGWFYLINEFWGDTKETMDFKQKVSDPKEYPFAIRAKLKSGQNIGYAYVDHAGNRCFIQEVDVIKKYRRKGVATAMYDFAEQLTGKKCVPSSEVSDDEDVHLSLDAKKFWEKRNKKDNLKAIILSHYRIVVARYDINTLMYDN